MHVNAILRTSKGAAMPSETAGLFGRIAGIIELRATLL
jgi:hypothetical protein